MSSRALKASKGDVLWFLPVLKSGRVPKKPFAYSTVATSDLVKARADQIEELIGTPATWAQIYDCIVYDQEARAILKQYIDNGFGDEAPQLGPIVDENSFALHWRGKRAAILEADQPIRLRHIPASILTERPVPVDKIEATIRLDVADEDGRCISIDKQINDLSPDASLGQVMGAMTNFARRVQFEVHHAWVEFRIQPEADNAA